MSPDRLTPRARMARSHLERILSEHPGIAERTGRYLAGDLEGGPMTEKENMRNLTLRLPGSIVDRAEALAPAVEAKENVSSWWGGKVTTSTVLRAALLAGLDLLEERYGATKAKRRPKSK